MSCRPLPWENKKAQGSEPDTLKVSLKQLLHQSLPSPDETWTPKKPLPSLPLDSTSRLL